MIDMIYIKTSARARAHTHTHTHTHKHTQVVVKLLPGNAPGDLMFFFFLKRPLLSDLIYIVNKIAVANIYINDLV